MQPVCCAGALVLGVALLFNCSGANAQTLSQAITNQSSATISVMGYNETGFMNTSEVHFHIGSLLKRWY